MPWHSRPRRCRIEARKGIAQGAALIRGGRFNAYLQALLADVHFGDRGMTPDRLVRIVKQANRSHPDLILPAGDFVTGHDAQAQPNALPV